MTRVTRLIALAFAAAAIAATIATSATASEEICSTAASPSTCYDGKPFVDPLGISYQKMYGTGGAQVGAGCSDVDSPSTCYGGKPFVDPLAISYLTWLGMTPAQIEDWTTGVCSQAKKPAVCTVSFQQTTATPTVTSSGGFAWGDATIGAGATLGAVLLLAGLGAIFLMSRNDRRRTVAGA